MVCYHSIIHGMMILTNQFILKLERDMYDFLFIVIILYIINVFQWIFLIRQLLNRDFILDEIPFLNYHFVPTLFSIYQSLLKHNYAIQTKSCLLNEPLPLHSPKYLEDLYLDFFFTYITRAKCNTIICFIGCVLFFELSPM